MLRLLILGATIFVIYKLFFGGKKKTQKDFENIKNSTASEMVKDPICGAYVSTKGDIRVRDGENVYFFCSYECRDKFLMKMKNEKSK